MNKALLFKEWIKTRWMFLLMFVVFILAMGYIALRISSAARNVGMPHLWEVFILKNVVLLDQIKVLPLLAGISMVRHDTPASIMRFRILSTYGVDYSGTRVEPANL